MLKSTLLKAAAVAALSVSTWASAQAVDLQFMFPVAVGGKAATTIQELTDEYMAENPDVKIDAVYAGSYADTVAKVVTASRGGQAPQLAVILASDTFTLYDEDLILPFDDFLTSAEDKEWLKGFYPGFLENGTIDGKTYGIPFQRSTPVLYYNKDAFKEAGLDPEKAPATWEEMVEYGKKLTKRDADGKVTQWGVRIPTSGFPYWLFQGLAIENGATLADADGTKTHFDDPKVIEALEFMVSLVEDEKIMAPGILDWGATPKAFFEGQDAMVWTTTGNLTNFFDNSPVPFGVGMLPAKVQRGAPTGGGSLYLFKGSSEEQTEAAVKFVKWITDSEQSAKWTIATGYVAPRPATWETKAMKDYVAGHPQVLVARDQLQYAKAELSTYQNQRIYDILNDALAAAVTGQKKPAEALKEAQAKAEAILSDYR